MVEHPIEKPQQDVNFYDLSYLIASFLDPLFKFYWIETIDLDQRVKSALKRNITELIFRECNMLEKNKTKDKDKKPLNKAPESQICSPNKIRKMFNYSKVHEKETKINEADLRKKIENEINLFVSIEYNEDIKCDKFWKANCKAFNYLSQLATKYLPIPSGTNPVERLFSESGYINRPHRTKILPQNLESTVILKTNLKYL